MARKRRKKPIYLHADKNVPYGSVVTVMADIKQAGLKAGDGHPARRREEVGGVALNGVPFSAGIFSSGSGMPRRDGSGRWALPWPCISSPLSCP